MQFSIRAKGRSSSRYHICEEMVAQRCSESCKAHRNQFAKTGIKAASISVIKRCPLVFQVAFQ